MAQPTTAQLQIIIAALARGYTFPSTNGNQTGVFPGGGNQIQIPIGNNPQGNFNTTLGANLQVSADANYLYVNQNVGDSGLT